MSPQATGRMLISRWTLFFFCLAKSIKSQRRENWSEISFFYARQKVIVKNHVKIPKGKISLLLSWWSDDLNLKLQKLEQGRRGKLISHFVNYTLVLIRITRKNLKKVENGFEILEAELKVSTYFHCHDH